MENKKENLLQDVPAEQRAEMLKTMATKTDTEKVRRPYSEDEKTQMREFVSDESINVMDRKEEFSVIRKTFNDALKAADKSIIDALKGIKKGYSENDEPVFLMDDQDAGEMNVYDVNGVYLYSRKLYADEKQTRIVDMTQRTGTNG